MTRRLPSSIPRVRPAPSCRARGAVGARSRHGFTYAESMISLAVISLAGAALLTSVAGTVSSSHDALYRSIGQGLARQMMDEIAASTFPSGNVVAATIKYDRSEFTSVDDYANWTESPPRTKFGEVLGSDNGATTSSYMPSMMGQSGNRAVELQAAPGFLQRFTRSVRVERVQPGPQGWTVVAQPTPHRRVTVIVTYTGTNQPAREVARITRVFSAVSPSP